MAKKIRKRGGSNNNQGTARSTGGALNPCHTKPENVDFLHPNFDPLKCESGSLKSDPRMGGWCSDFHQWNDPLIIDIVKGAQVSSLDMGGQYSETYSDCGYDAYGSCCVDPNTCDTATCSDGIAACCYEDGDGGHACIETSKSECRETYNGNYLWNRRCEENHHLEPACFKTLENGGSCENHPLCAGCDPQTFQGGPGPVNCDAGACCASYNVDNPPGDGTFGQQVEGTCCFDANCQGAGISLNCIVDLDATQCECAQNYIRTLDGGENCTTTFHQYDIPCCSEDENACCSYGVDGCPWWWDCECDESASPPDPNCWGQNPDGNGNGVPDDQEGNYCCRITTQQEPPPACQEPTCSDTVVSESCIACDGGNCSGCVSSGCTTATIVEDCSACGSGAAAGSSTPLSGGDTWQVKCIQTSQFDCASGYWQGPGTHCTSHLGIANEPCRSGTCRSASWCMEGVSSDTCGSVYGAGPISQGNYWEATPFGFWEAGTSHGCVDGQDSSIFTCGEGIPESDNLGCCQYITESACEEAGGVFKEGIPCDVPADNNCGANTTCYGEFEPPAAS